MTDTDDNARQEGSENTKPDENQERKTVRQNEPVDPLDTGCGFVPGEGI